MGVSLTKLLLRTDRRTGLVFARDKGLDLQVQSFRGNRRDSHHFISFADVENVSKADQAGMPRVTNWILIIPTYQCIIRYVVLPSANPVEIDKMLEFELPNIVPYNTQSWVWDFSIIDQQQDGASKILVVISPSSIIEDYLKTLLSLSIKPEVITTSVMFHTWLLSREKSLLESRSLGCFCLNEDQADFSIIENGRITFLRGVRLKKEFCENTRFIEAEIRRSLSIVKEQGFASYPNLFFAFNLNGSGVDYANIIEKVSGIPTKDIKPGVSYNKRLSITGRLIATSPDDYSLFSPGNAQINLLPKHLKEKHCRSKKRKQMVLHALKVCFVLLLMFFSIKTSIWRKSRMLERYEQRLSAITPMAEKLQFLQQQLAIIEGQLRGSASTLDIISELYKVLPKDITIHYLDIDQNRKTIIRAQAGFLSQAFDCINLLEQSDYFTNVRQRYATQRRLQDSVLIDFEIVADFQNTGRRKDIK